MERYTKIRNVGKGNMGQCMLVRSNEDSKLYVMKLIDLSKMNKKERTASLSEAKVLSSLSHPNVINYVDSFLSRKTEHLCIVMEFAEGGDLSNKIKQSKGKFFSEEQVLDWFIQTCLAVAYCHKKRVLHRDIKSQNIFLTDEGVVKVGDFGISRVLQNTCDCAHTFVGTPYYLSPELVQEKPYNSSSDCWALGVLLFELCALKHPFNATDMKGLMYKILRVIYDPPPPQYSGELRAIVSKLLVKEPNRRPKVSAILELPIIKRRIAKLTAGTSDANMPATYLNQLIENGLIEGPRGVAEEPDTASSSGDENICKLMGGNDAQRLPPVRRNYLDPQYPKVIKPFVGPLGIPAKPIYKERQEMRPSKLLPLPALPARYEEALAPSALPDVYRTPLADLGFNEPPPRPAFARPIPGNPLLPVPQVPTDPRSYLLPPSAQPGNTRFSAYSHFYEARRQAEVNKLRNAQHRCADPLFPLNGANRGWKN
jgi:serine/threonine protein kinase